MTMQRILNALPPYTGHEVLLLGFIVLPISYIVYQRFLSPLRKIPGPFWASVTPLWRIRRVIKGDWHAEITRLHGKYGNNVRIAPNEVSLNTPSAVQTVYAHGGTPWVKAAWYQAWWVRSDNHPFFAEIDPALHRDLRRRVSRAYTMSYVLAMESYIDNIVELFMEKMSANSGSRIDLAEWTQFFAFDVVGELAFGKEWGLLKAGKDHDDLLHWVYMLLSTTASLGWTWKTHKLAQFGPVRWILNNQLFSRVGKTLDCWPMPEVQRRVVTKMESHTDPDRNDLLTHFQQMKDPDGNPVLPFDVLGESINVVVAGADTTAISIRAIVRFVAGSPRVYRKLQEEVDMASSAGKLSPVVRFEEGLALSYFQACVKEALRLFPAVGYQLPRVAPDDTYIDDAYIPRGTTVGINAWSLHRNKEVYGEDAEEFRPERWQEKDNPERLKQMEQCFATFGFGSRTCIGRNMANMEINKLVPTLFRDFDIDICDIEDPWVLTCAWFVYQSNFSVRMRKRSKGSFHPGNQVENVDSHETLSSTSM